MRKILLHLLFISMCCALSSVKAQNHAQLPKEEDSVRLFVLKNGMIFTGERSDKPSLKNIYVRNSTIAAITPSTSPAPAGFEQAQVYDLTGKYIVPGLIDAHVHLITQTGKILEDIQPPLTELLRKELMSGVTTVRDMGGDGLLLGTFARSAQSGRIASPDILYSAFFAGRAYYNLYNRRPATSKEYMPHENLPWQQTVDENTNVQEAITRAKASGATGIKLYSDISAEMVKKLSAEAKRQGLRVWSHATVNPALPSDAVAAGVEVLSHAYLISYEQMKGKNQKFDFDYETSKSLVKNFNGLNELFDSMKKNNVIIDATLFLTSLDSIDSPDWENSVHIIKEAHARGVKVCIGTDWMFNEEDNICNIYEEMRLFVEKCGYTPLDVISAATRLNAEALGLTDRGVLKAGKRADIIVVNKNPFSDIGNIKQIDKVIKGGIVYLVN